MKALGLGQELQRNLKRNAKEPLVTGKQTAPVRTDVLTTSCPPLDNFTGREHSLDTEDMIRSHPIFQAVRAA